MIFRLFSRLPLGVLYGFASIIAFTMRYLVKYRLEVVRGNIDSSFPEKSTTERLRIINQFYKNLADFMVETLKGMSISSSEIKARVQMSNQEVIEQYFGADRSVIILTSHQFNWEWLLFACCLQLSAPMSPVYKLLNNKYFDDLMFRTRARFGGKPIEMQETLMEIMKRKKSVNGFGLIADQVPLPEAEKYWAQFLGRETAFFVGPEKIAHMTKYPVVFASIKRVKRGYYEVNFESIAEPPYAKDSHLILDTYIEKCEQILRAQPSNWLWSHRRWKYKKPLYDN